MRILSVRSAALAVAITTSVVGCGGNVESASGGAGGAPGGVTSDCDAAIAVGLSHTCALNRDGAVFCWGDNTYGQLGHERQPQPEASPVAVTALQRDVVEISAGWYHTCARKRDGTVWCWGDDQMGQLGTAPGPWCTGVAGSSFTLTQVSALGDGVVQISAGRAHNCALKSDGTLWCWGYNEFGTLGDGTLGTVGEANEANYCKATPVQVSALGSSVVRVVAGYYHTCALKNDGTLWCWGDNSYGELGDGTTEGELCGLSFACKPFPVQVAALGNTVMQVAAGDWHTCAIKSDGTLWCWGRNDYGTLGDGTMSGEDCGGTPCRPVPVPVTALGAAGIVVAATGGTTCARTADGLLSCWGGNAVGQLGDGTISGEPCGPTSGSVCKPSPVPVTALGKTVGTVAVGGHSCATKPDGTLWCWGSNRSGELGDGTISDTGCMCKPSPVEVIGLGATVGAACRER